MGLRSMYSSSGSVAIFPFHDICVSFQAVWSLETDIIPSKAEGCEAICIAESCFMHLVNLYVCRCRYHIILSLVQRYNFYLIKEVFWLIFFKIRSFFFLRISKILCNFGPDI